MNMTVNDPTMKSLLERLFENHSVRMIRDEHDEPWFVAKDVCDCLEIRNSRDAIRAIDQDDLASVKTTSGGQIRAMQFVNEAGLYCLIFKSRKPVARRFKNWVTREVLPSIRRHGIYEGGTAALGERRLTAAAYAELRGIQGTTTNGISQRARHLCMMHATPAADGYGGKRYPVHILDRACARLVARTGALCGGPATVQLELL